MPLTDFNPVFIDTFENPVGAIPTAAARLLDAAEVVKLTDDGLVLPSPSAGLEHAFAAAHPVLHARDFVGPIRAEAMSILVDWSGPVIGTIDRSLLRIFGLPGTKVHINGIVPTVGGPKVWLARRAGDRRASPLHLDTMVAGGQPYGKTAFETAMMEAGEEAGIDPRQLAALREVKRMHIVYTTPEGHHRERLVIYDLLVPESFSPVLHDGELVESLLVTLEEMETLLDGADRFKYNSAVVCRDLLGRIR